jgi:DNA-binding MarR family transcriptional regulator
MDNHYHLLIETPKGILSRGMMQLDSTMREIGEYLGLHYATISRAVKKCEEKKKSGRG